eukprot:TRINITY_DN2920_c0_g1_i10.p1 TRINITY_DN2920_c0_g1~~TRINITY_DN2920_c0_g1_i10.p1  ORF type:complete len:330 (+),score=97.33 TRINITY_DN2920_c0_g1_i10:1633-2622(+)
MVNALKIKDLLNFSTLQIIGLTGLAKSILTTLVGLYESGSWSVIGTQLAQLSVVDLKIISTWYRHLGARIVAHLGELPHPSANLHRDTRMFPSNTPLRFTNLDFPMLYSSGYSTSASAASVSATPLLSRHMAANTAAMGADATAPLAAAQPLSLGDLLLKKARPGQAAGSRQTRADQHSERDEPRRGRVVVVDAAPPPVARDSLLEQHKEQARKAREEQERKAKEERERKAKEEQERKAKEEQERKAKEEKLAREKLAAQRQAPESSPPNAEKWTAEEQVALERALAAVPPSADRWARVAPLVGTRSAEECERRFAELKAFLKKQKQAK